MTKKMNKAVKRFAENEITHNVNSLCWFFYQPKFPTGCERFKKSMK